MNFFWVNAIMENKTITTAERMIFQRRASMWSKNPISFLSFDSFIFTHIPCKNNALNVTEILIYSGIGHQPLWKWGRCFSSELPDGFEFCQMSHTTLRADSAGRSIFGVRTISVRRFFALPSGVLLAATGWFSPLPEPMICAGLTLYFSVRMCSTLLERIRLNPSCL
jgi:hypothetical protein